MKKIFMVPVLMMLFLAGCNMIKNDSNEEVTMGNMTEDRAREIAREIAGFEGGDLASDKGTYNPNSRTWWFDADLPSAPEGCNPASVVYEDTEVGEINWRCTGLLEPEDTQLTDNDDPTILPEDLNGVMVSLFENKYPENAGNVVVDITHQTTDHARGNVSFAEGMAGGLWLAANINGQWQIVHDGNGAIPCSLRDDYGFPDEMLTDCAEL